MPTLWQQIARTANEHKDRRITDLFVADPKRFDHFSRQIPGMLVDFSKTNIDNETLDNLIALAGERGVSRHISAMFAGEPINVTEDRPVLHTTCRAGDDATAETKETLARMRVLADNIRSGSFTGYSGKAIRHIVVIGIGGSVLGLQAASIALRAFQASHLKLHIVSNVEGSDLAHVIDHINLEETLFFIASKSFSTPETMLNAELARTRLLAHYYHEGASVARHFIALSSHAERVKAFGIAPENMFAFRDWVGGRFSSWSAIGLPLMVMIGPDHFQQWLAGAHAMDMHFHDTPLGHNLPVLLAMVGIWHRNFCDYPAMAMVPYHSALGRLPAWLQQVDMESNGKRVDINGQPVTEATGPIVLGEPGTDAQHSFFQWVHQSTDVMPVDFIAVAQPCAGNPLQHQRLTAHMLAQAEALLCGKEDIALPHKHFTGNRPSTAIIIDKLDPAHLGMIMAMYEHKVFVQGVIWGINSFDQFGVELGKVLAAGIEKELLDGVPAQGHDGSTLGLMRYLLALQAR